MLQVYHSNRLEILFSILRAQRASHTLEDPFVADQILVANPGIGRWLSLQLASQDGIAANIDYPLPASFIWQLYRDHLHDVPERSAFNKPRLQWTLMQLLGCLPSDDIYAPLRHYLHSEDEDQRHLKQVQLATKIADVFDQYLVYRPDWLLAWEQGESPKTAPGNWQAAIWRELQKQLLEPHRASLHAAFCAAASKGALIKDKLPPRLYIFNVVSIPPSYLDVLTALAQYLPVDLYLLNPSIEYWDEITDRKRQLKLRRIHSKDAALDEANPLLAATGKLGQQALQLLHERGQFVHEENFSVPPEERGRLAQLQREILTLSRPSPQPDLQLGFDFDQLDQSIEVHSAHSVLREVQVLHDQLLARFERLENLGPADVVVMVPNVDKYTAAVSAVFGSASGERSIPWEIADRSLSQTDPVVSLIRSLLDLPQSQFTAREVLGWLAQPVLARQFELLDSGNQQLLARWVRESNVRRQLGPAPLAANAESLLNSWSFGLRRLLAAYATAGSDQAVVGVYPSGEISGSDALLLGKLIDCLDRLAYWHNALRTPRNMQAWLEVFNQVVADLLSPDDNEALAIQQLRDIFASLAENAELANFREDLSPTSMLALLDNALSGSNGKTQRFLTGRVTISSMVPLRSVPFRVVCLLGLNDGDFPRQNRPVSFDLIQNQPRKGDRSVREDDHYLFLEALLSARDEVVLSYIGRSAVDNSEQTPSILLSELIEYFRNHKEPLTVTQHPLQAFSSRYFDGSDPKLFSYAAQWLAADKKASRSTSTQLPEPGELALSILLRFWRDPSGYYCRETLRLGLSPSHLLVDDSEPFELDALQSYQQRSQLLQGVLSVPPLSAEQGLNAAIGRGELPHGQFAPFYFAQSYEEASKLAQRIRAFSEEALNPAVIDLHAHGWHITGQLESLYLHQGATTLLLTRPGAFKALDLVAMSLNHLIGCAAGLLQTDSLFVARDKNIQMRHLGVSEALEQLGPWLHYFNIGQILPLHFFANSALSYLEKPADLDTQWLGSEHNRGESQQEAVQLLWPDLESPMQLDEFTYLAEALLAPSLALLSEKSE